MNYEEEEAGEHPSVGGKEPSMYPDDDEEQKECDEEEEEEEWEEDDKEDDDEQMLQDIFGEPGPSNALSARLPPPPREERGRKALMQNVGLLDQNGRPDPNYKEALALIRSATGDVRGLLSEAMFLALASQHWGMAVPLAHACFQACDLDNSGRLNPHEFALLYRAVIVFDPARDNGDVKLVELRRRIIFARYAKNGKAGELDKESRYRVAHDLAQGQLHVEHLVRDALRWHDGPAIGLKAFADSHTTLNEAHLHLSDALVPEHGEWQTLSRKSSGPQLRVVLDPRAVLGGAIVGTTDTVNGPQIVGQLSCELMGSSDLSAGRRRNQCRRLNPTERVAIPGDRSGGRKQMSASVGNAAVNVAFDLDPDLQAPAESDWRGAIARPRGSHEHHLAQTVVDRAQLMATRISMETDVSDSAWMGEGSALRELLDTEAPAEQSRRFAILAREVQRVAMSQPMVVRVPVPAKIFGDVHGQLRDLLLLFAFHGFPSHRGGDVETTAYVFNGDFIDRGAHQLETLVLLFALKCLYPSRIFLVRGNHEFRSQTERYGFQDVCRSFREAHDDVEDVYEKAHGAFEWLPLAALVGGCVAVMHGGIGDGSWTLDALNAVPRPLKTDWSSDVAEQALWSDPSDSDAEMMRGVHPNPARGAAMKTFGPDVTARWCQENHVQLVVRSHQYVREGVKFMHSGRLATVFSARNYNNDSCPNDSALLLLAADEAGALRVRAKRLAHRPTR